ncbi:XRE family transcriptional regulator [Pseudonocardia tropica]|uniref:XRE family transcriptional regulator n=1 Tax=Pseudonocardia tropica TaxID=681289 RepID=A0ABV1JTF2_9PSEU
MEEAARRLGIATGTFRSWLDGRHVPKVSIFDYWTGLADLARMSEVELLATAGVVPEQVINAISLSQAARELRDGLERTRQSLSQASMLVHSSLVAQVVNELSLSGVEWEIRLRSAHRGRAFRVTYHHYVGLIRPDELDSWTYEETRSYVQSDLLGHVWDSLGLYWRVAEVHDWPNPPDLVIQVPEQEACRPPLVTSPMMGERTILVCSPPWGYGELLGSMVADAIGHGNVDFRYRGGIPDDASKRVATIQADVDGTTRDHVIGIPPLSLLEGLQLGRRQLDGRVVVVISYGANIERRAAVVYADALRELARSPEAGVRTVIGNIATALEELPAGSPYYAVHIADADVEVCGVVDRHLLNDTVGRLALSLARMILLDHGRPPVPVGGPLRDYMRSGVRPGTFATMNSTVVRATTGRGAPQADSAS